MQSSCTQQVANIIPLCCDASVSAFSSDFSLVAFYLIYLPNSYFSLPVCWSGTASVKLENSGSSCYFRAWGFLLFVCLGVLCLVFFSKRSCKICQIDAFFSLKSDTKKHPALPSVSLSLPSTKPIPYLSAAGPRTR